MRKYLPLMALSAFLLLTGCFVADEPLITKDTADYPVEKVSFYIGSDRQDVMTLVRSGDVYKYSDSRGSPDTHFMLKKVSDDVYVSQQTFQIFGTANIYTILKHAGDVIEARYCGNYSQKTLDKLGIELLKDDALSDMIHGKGCRVTNLNQILALSNEMPDGKREIRTFKIVSVEKK